MHHPSQTPLQTYVELLCKWNKAYNLTAIRDREQIEIKHIADSLAVSPYLYGDTIIDVGTGGGLPGIPLAISHPEKQFTLLDSNGKKTRFLRQVKQQLELDNVHVVHARVEEFLPENAYSSVISRAFASICDMLRATSHLLQADGRFLAMKGVLPEQELQQLPAGFSVHATRMIQVSGLQAERCLIEITVDDK